MVVNDKERLLELPPSAKLVYFVLRQYGPMTQSAITEESMLPPRTVRYAIKRLKKTDILIERTHIKDARQTVYELSISSADNDTGKRGTATASND